VFIKHLLPILSELLERPLTPAGKKHSSGAATSNGIRNSSSFSVSSALSFHLALRWSWPAHGNAKVQASVKASAGNELRSDRVMGESPFVCSGR
jgi:hypothetical protein